MFVDIETTVYDEVRTGTYCLIFHPGKIISGKNSYRKQLRTRYDMNMLETVTEVMTVL